MTQVSWHGKGDYFSSVMPKGDSKAVLIHQLSRRRSQVIIVYLYLFLQRIDIFLCFSDLVMFLLLVLKYAIDILFIQLIS